MIRAWNWSWFMAGRNGRFSAGAKRERSGSGSPFEHALLFACGVLVGFLARRATKRRAERSSFPDTSPAVTPGQKVVEDRGAIPQSQTVSATPAHEKSEVNLAMLGGVLAVLALGAFVIHSALWWWVNAKQGEPREGEISRWKVFAPEVSLPQRNFPELQISPPGDLRDFLARQEQALSSPGRDATSGALRIPIEQALDIVSRRGVPKWRTMNAKQISPLDLQRQRGDGAPR
jgi:hypothetical protein